MNKLQNYKNIITIFLSLMMLMLSGCNHDKDEVPEESFSEVNNLAGLTVSEGSLSPGFSLAGTAYTVDVENAVSSIQVTATLEVASATIQINGTLTSSGTASGAIELAVGTNTITVLVTAESGDTRTITITVTRAEISNNTNLSNLAISVGEMTPIFDKETLAYTASVASDVGAVNVTPTAEDDNATIYVGESTTASGTAERVSLSVGSNSINVKVVAEDGVTEKTYNVVITRAVPLSNNANLRSLSVSTGTLNPGFNSSTLGYTVDVSSGTGAIIITQSLDDANASMTFNSVATNSGASTSVDLVEGENTITLIITAEDGTTAKTYTIVVTRPAPGESSLLLSTLDGTTGIRFDGAGTNHLSGNSVSNAGDVNGDGYDDLIIGAYYATYNSTGSGSSYVIFGKADGYASSMDLTDVNGSNGFRFDGQYATYAGRSVSAAGDVNGDGYDDVIIGSSKSAKAFLLFGKASGFPTVIDYTELDGTNGVAIIGRASTIDVSAAGDMNGDGFDDIIIGSYNAGFIYVMYGRSEAFSATFSLTSLTGDDGFQLTGYSYSKFGSSVSGVGDINGDGFDDIILGDPHANYYVNNLATGYNHGKSYVVFGRASGFEASWDVSTLDGSNGFTLEQTTPYLQFGRNVSGLGDINGDGFDDMIIEAPGSNTTNIKTKVPAVNYIIFGKASGYTPIFQVHNLDGNNGYRIDGLTDDGGGIVSKLGDINADGYDDIIIGVPSASYTAIASGSAYLIYGKATGYTAAMSLAAIDGNNGFRMDGDAETDFSGVAVSGAGDINGDGYADFLIGATSATPDGITNQGASYLVFGKAQ